MRFLGARSIAAALASALIATAPVAAQQLDRSRDRGPGQPTSMFGTYIERGQFLFYPFFEYYHDKDAEYKPQELGYTLDQDFRGRYHANEALLFFAYGLTDRLAVEFEVATINARLQKSSSDPSAMPVFFQEEGLGDVEGQLRWRWNRETNSKPEFFSYFETVFPSQRDNVLIGTSDYEFKFGTGFVRGFTWGTATVRAAFEYDKAESKGELGEVAVEYLRRLSSRYRMLLAFEGTQDEVEGITEFQVMLGRAAVLKLNNAFGVTSKATDWAPEVGVMFRFR